jgi:predicted dinucleotide-binding enzyme
MKIAVIGTGEVGRRLAERFAELGHAVSVGSRTTDNPELQAWAAGAGVRYATFAEAAAEGELVVNAT